MCVGENSAPHVEHYLNAQLTALWENATECVSHHGNSLKPGDTHKYSFSLAEYYFGKHRSRGHASKADMMFYASFDRPQLDFICNHNAIFRVKLKEGHYSPDYLKATDASTAHHERNRSFRDLEVAFRVPFELSRISSQDTKIGNGVHVIKLFVLDFTKAQMISVQPEAGGAKEALSFYLANYLRFLQGAGHHVFFSLPDFDDDLLSLTVDFSSYSSALIDVGELCGVSVEKINSYLSSAWLKSALLAAGQHASESDRSKMALAEYRSTWIQSGGDLHFHAKLGAPRIKALCDQEVVLYFTVDEVLFYDSEDFSKEPKKQYSDWEIAVLVNVIHTTEDNGNVTRCRLNFDSGRFIRQFCSFPDLDDTDEETVRCWTYLVEFFTSEYFEILEAAEFHIIYHIDVRWPKVIDLPFAPPSPSEPGTCYDPSDPSRPVSGPDSIGESGTRSIELTEKTDMGGFDEIIAISQTSINAQFYALWQQSRTSKDTTLFKWSYQEFFQATFKPITVRLLSNGRALVWVRLQEGFLKTLKNWLPWSEGTKYNFEDWCLAFEVKLKMCDHSELEDISATWKTKFQESYAYKKHGTCDDRVLKHLYMDFKNAEFLYEFSTFDGLFHRNEKRPIDKVQAIVTYIKSHYFSHLVSNGHHLLHTVPVWKTGSKPLTTALTTITFHVYSKDTFERHNWGTFSRSDEPIIMILGMCNFRALPCSHLKFSTNWILRLTKETSYGTVCLSKSVFLNDRLLSLLASVNALTTVVPIHGDDNNNPWRMKLTTWAKLEGRPRRPCSWSAVGEEVGVLKYKWEHRDEWAYEHESSDRVANGTYSTSCITRNYLEIPTTFKRGGLEIKIRGEVALKLGFKDHVQKWSTQSTATWNATFVLRSDARGLHVALAGASTPVFHQQKSEGSTTSSVHTDPETLLKSQLPGTVQLGEVLGEFKAFEGVYHGCYPSLSAYSLAQPLFNKAGDLLFELRPYTPNAPVSTPVAKPSHANGQINGTVTSNVPTATTTVTCGYGTNGMKYSDVAKTKPVLRQRPSLIQRVKTVAKGVAQNLTGEYNSPNGNGLKSVSISSSSSTTTINRVTTSSSSSTLAGGQKPAATVTPLKDVSSVRSMSSSSSLSSA